MTIRLDRESADLLDLDHLLTWRESSTSGSAIAAALQAARASSDSVLATLRDADLQLALTRGRDADAPRHLRQVVTFAPA